MRLPGYDPGDLLALEDEEPMILEASAAGSKSSPSLDTFPFILLSFSLGYGSMLSAGFAVTSPFHQILFRK